MVCTVAEGSPTIDSDPRIKAPQRHQTPALYCAHPDAGCQHQTIFAQDIFANFSRISSIFIMIIINYSSGGVQASSPDEAALVAAAKVFGYFFHQRSPTSVTVRQLLPQLTAPGVATEEAQYKILAVLEFNSTRKRQSVIVRQPDGTVLLQCKVRLLSRACLKLLAPGVHTRITARQQICTQSQRMQPFGI